MTREQAVQVARMRSAAAAAWVRFLRTRKVPAYWPELALLAESERDAVRRVVLQTRARWAWQQVWEAELPRSTVDGRRFA